MFLSKRRLIQLICFSILMIFLALALTVNASDCDSNKNAKDLKTLQLKMQNDSRTLVSLDPAHPWAMISKKEADFMALTGKLPTYENLKLVSP